MPYVKTADQLYEDVSIDYHIPLVFQGNEFFQNNDSKSSFDWIKAMGSQISKMND